MIDLVEWITTNNNNDSDRDYIGDVDLLKLDVVLGTTLDIMFRIMNTSPVLI